MILDVLTQHAEEAAFLWTLRDRAVSAAHFTLTRLTDFDDRLEAHLDGLRLHGEAGWHQSWTALKQLNGTGEAFAAAVLSLEGGKREHIELVLAAVSSQPNMRRAVVSALGWAPDRVAAAQIPPLYTHGTPAGRAIGIAAAAVRRMNAVSVFPSTLNDADLAVRARALRAIGELGAGAFLIIARKHLSHVDPECRFWGCWSAARLGDRTAAAELQIVAQNHLLRHREAAANLAVRLIDPGASIRWLGLLPEFPGGKRLALKAFGWLGDSAAVPRLLEAMKNPEYARVAGEALSFITGVDLDELKLDAQKPEGFEAGPTDDPADENVEMDADDDLPWPDVDKVTKWWEKNRASFPSGKRYILGKPMTPEWLREVLRIGKQRQRAAAALELGVREPNKALFNVKAPGWRQ